MTASHALEGRAGNALILIQREKDHPGKIHPQAIIWARLLPLADNICTVFNLECVRGRPRAAHQGGNVAASGSPCRLGWF